MADDPFLDAGMRLFLDVRRNACRMTGLFVGFGSSRWRLSVQSVSVSLRKIYV
jgi:hypothetical protein